ncbi:Uncharacterised protein [Vibrio cholerae]|nr:Uncharacterised protein [Vibrio cholerae]
MNAAILRQTYLCLTKSVIYCALLSESCILLMIFRGHSLAR